MEGWLISDMNRRIEAEKIISGKEKNKGKGPTLDRLGTMPTL